MKTHREENVKFIIPNCKDRFKLNITTTCIRILEAVTRRGCAISQNSQKNTCVRVSLLIKMQASANYIKKVLAKVFSFEFCEIFKNTFFIERWLLFKYVFIWIISRYFYRCYFEHVFVCWKRYRITIVLLQILEIPYPANKYSKSTTEALKQDVKSVKS